MRKQKKEIAEVNCVAKKKKSVWKKIVKQRYLLIMVVPFLVWYFVFAYVPMFGLIGAFQDYSPVKGYFGSEWVGLKYFKQFLEGYHFPILMRNTICLSLLKLAVGFPMPIIFAIFLSELRFERYKKVVQTVSYLPHFVSWVVIMAVFGRILSAEGGIINNLLVNLGVIDQPIAFMSSSSYAWFISVATEVWKGLGWGSIIYLAAIVGVNSELYEAAAIDGANRMNKIWHITLPCIRPIIAVQLILKVGGLLGGNSDQLWLMGVATNLDKLEIIDTYVIRVGLQKAQYSLATAVGLMNSVVAVVLILLTDFIVKKMGEEGLL